MNTRKAETQEDTLSEELRQRKIHKNESAVARNALTDAFGTTNPSKSRIVRCKVGLLRSLCDTLELRTGTSGKKDNAVKEDYVGAIVQYLQLSCSDNVSYGNPKQDSMQVDANDNPEDEEEDETLIIEENITGGEGSSTQQATSKLVAVRVFNRPHDYTTCFISECMYSRQADGSINLIDLARHLALDQGCDVVDPTNFRPLYCPNHVVDRHYVSAHIRKAGFLRVVSR